MPVVLSPEEFFQKYKSQVLVRPRQRTTQTRDEFFLQANRNMAIRAAARNRYRVWLKYLKITTGKVCIRLVEPYSFRYVRTREGLRKVLFGFDFYHKNESGRRKPRIKMFVLRNIQQIAISRLKFKPRWRVELQ